MRRHQARGESSGCCANTQHRGTNRSRRCGGRTLDRRRHRLGHRSRVRPRDGSEREGCVLHVPGSGEGAARVTWFGHADQQRCGPAGQQGSRGLLRLKGCRCAAGKDTRTRPCSRRRARECRVPRRRDVADAAVPSRHVWRWRHARISQHPAQQVSARRISAFHRTE